MKKPPEPKADYEVGYGRPPEATQFKPGQSGNTRGRPKKGVDLAKIYREAASAKVSVTVDNRKVQMTKIEAAIHTSINKAARGDIRALVHVLGELQRFGIGLGVPEAGTGQVPVSDFYASLIERALADRTPPAVDEPGTADDTEAEGKEDET